MTLARATAVRLIGAPIATDTYDDKRPELHGLEIGACCPACGVEQRRRVGHDSGVLGDYNGVNQPVWAPFMCETEGCEPSPDAGPRDPWGPDTSVFQASVVLLYTLAIPGEDGTWRLAPPAGLSFEGAALTADDARLLPGDLIIRTAHNGYLVVEVGDSGEWSCSVYESHGLPGENLRRLLKRHFHDDLRTKHKGGLDLTVCKEGWVS